MAWSEMTSLHFTREPRVTAPNDRRDITLDTVVVASPDQVSSDLAGETVLLSMTSAHYFGLEGIGSRIWALVNEPVSVVGICATIVSEYDVTPARCEADVLRFVRDLADRGLVEVRVGG
jgi:hypothetical protein